MTIDREALQLSAEKKLAAIGAINEDQSNRVGGPWVNAPLEAVLDAILPEVQRETWDEAIDAARNVVHRRAGQPHETDIDLITLENPYRKGASE